MDDMLEVLGFPNVKTLFFSFVRCFQSGALRALKVMLSWRQDAQAVHQVLEKLRDACAEFPKSNTLR